jgi:hypothetical protein
MVLEFMFVIPTLQSFALGLYISLGVVNDIWYEELAPTKGAFH